MSDILNYPKEVKAHQNSAVVVGPVLSGLGSGLQHARRVFSCSNYAVYQVLMGQVGDNTGWCRH